jgi:hypothetical protein
MSDEISELHAAILSAHHAKARARVLDALRGGCALSPAEGAALADYIAGLTSPGKRGPKPIKFNSHTWWKRWIVTMARFQQARQLESTGKKLTNEAAVDVVVGVGGGRSENLQKYRDQALSEMNKRSRKGPR